jgi:hypothetical protein
MFLGNTQKVYILDKTEGNAASIAGHPAWGSVWYVFIYFSPLHTHHDLALIPIVY